MLIRLTFSALLLIGLLVDFGIVLALLHWVFD